MPDALDSFLADIDRAKLRVTQPSRVVFLCGGAEATDDRLPPQNLRDYLLRFGKISTKISADFVLAEDAKNLYRDTAYSDLINFEEDIAKISAIVLVISESAGSLAELGAFSANDTIRPKLRLIISEHNFNQQSFVRFGPVERIRNINTDLVGVFPWRNHKIGHVVKSSVVPLFKDIKNFINDQIKAIPKSFSYSSLGDATVFYDIFWLTQVAAVISPNTLYNAVNRIYPKMSQEEIRNKIFCMNVVGWMGKISYSNKEYYFCRKDVDIFDYAYFHAAKSKDSLRRRTDIRKVFKSIDVPPATVYKRAIDARSDNKS